MLLRWWLVRNWRKNRACRVAFSRLQISGMQVGSPFGRVATGENVFVNFNARGCVAIYSWSCESLWWEKTVQKRFFDQQNGVRQRIRPTIRIWWYAYRIRRRDQIERFWRVSIEKIGKTRRRERSSFRPPSPRFNDHSDTPHAHFFRVGEFISTYDSSAP